MKINQKVSIIVFTVVSLALFTCVSAFAIDYAKPVPLNKEAQASFDKINKKDPKTLRVAYMPPATEFNYYIAIGEGIKDLAQKNGVSTFMLAPQSGADINGQMGMLQDVISQKVDAIIISTHDENAAAPLVKRAIDQGIVVTIVNSDIPNFPTPIHAVVGYSQRKGTYKIGQYALKLAEGKPLKVGVLEGQPGYHSTERCGGFLDAIKGSNFEVVSSLDGKWNVEGGNTAGMDMLQAHPEIQLIFAANDYEIYGASMAAKALGRSDLILLGNDGDTSCGLEAIYDGKVTATVDTTPFVMGQVAMQVVLDIFNKSFQGGFVETPTTIVDKSNVLEALRHPERLYPKPSKQY
jgi:ribose transport system substrate-binding protein